ncbi:MAG TPA: lactonase family protein, partial [Sphingobacteriaceae bacterium]
MKKILLPMAVFALTLSDGFAQKFRLLIGTYTTGKSEGIYVYDFETSSGSFEYLSKATGVENPSYLAVSADNKNLYSVNETGEGTGGVSAFAYDNKNGELTFLNRVSSGGDHPCYITVDSDKKHVFAGNYSGGSLSVLPVKSDGGLGYAIQTIQHIGSGPNKARQEKPHVHMTMLSPDEKFLLVNDLGTDRITIYKYNAFNEQPLTSHSSMQVKAGSGPRHLTFDPAGRHVY